MADKDYIEKRIEEESAKIKVDSYQKVSSLGGWAGGGRTLWAISTIGVVAGALVGLVTPFAPVVVTAFSMGLGPALAAAASAIPASVATFSAMGLVSGFTGGLVLGRVSGSAAAVAQENEERMKEWTVRQMVAQNPETKIIPDEPEKPAPKKSFWKRAYDKYCTYINPRVGLTFAVIGAMGGLVMASAAIMTGSLGGTVIPINAISQLTGLAAEGLTAAAPAVIAYTTGVCASFGALWTFNFPKITSEVTGFFGRLSGGKIIGREWAPPKETLKSPAASYTGSPQLSEAAVRKFESFQEQVIAQRAAEEKAAEQLLPR